MFATRLFIAAALAVSAQTALAASCSRTYTVMAGDYCDKISAAQNVSTYQLAVSNANAVGEDCSNLQIGQQLCLATTDAEDCRTTYTVIPDDTCEGIAAKNSLNSTILLLNNPQINGDCSNIYVDEVLCTEQTVKVAPVPANGVTVKAPQTTIFVTQTPAGASATPVATPASKPAVAKPAAPASSKPTATPAPAAAAAAADNDDCDADSDAASNDNADGSDDDCDDSADAATPTNAATPANDSGSDNSDDDDDDLPFCDEL
jgi:LysM repeat protein